MASAPFDPARFRVLYPYWADANLFPDEYLQGAWDIAACYIADDGCCESAACAQNASYLMTAHLLWLRQLATSGQTGGGGVVSSATIDKVSVSFAVPPIRNAWQQWLAGSPYGLELWALLSMQGAGGFYVGGLPETSAFRKVGGVF